MRIVATIAVSIGLVACTPAPTYRPTSTYVAPPKSPEAKLEPGALVALSARQQQIVRSEVAKVLKDPESARFGKIAATKDKDGSLTVCGFLNAKNSYGGYTGMSPFIGAFLPPPQESTFKVIDIASKPTDRQAIISVCGQAGVPISQ